ncbi:hypothetical protein L0128_16655 [candidate division KSB1 bacterium]|nr:hypothetical protein [candidate division KSB1 bacterium]
MLKKMQKVSVAGLASHAPQIIDQLQELGVLHLIHLQDAYDASRIDKLQSEKNTIQNTLKYLAANQKELPATSVQLDPVEIIRQTAAIRTRLDEMVEERRKLLRQIDIWSFFGDFDPAQVLRLKNQGIYMQFFRANESTFLREDQIFDQHDVVVLEQKLQKVFFCTIGLVPIQSPLYEEIQLPEWGLAELRQRLVTQTPEKEKLEQELGVLCSQKEKLLEQYVHTENAFNFQKAVAQQVITGELFYLQGWAPEDQAPALKQLSDQAGFLILIEAPTAEDNPPTAHRNNVAGEIGESLIYIYDTPSYKDIDPSKTVFLFFTIFFGMIIGDAGYGTLLLLLSLWLIRGKRHGIKLFRKLSITVSISTILFGILNASYFAIKINPDTSIGRILYSLALLYKDTSQKEGLMAAMFFSLWAGVLNISWVNLYKAWHERKLSPLGWIPALIGLIPLLKLLFGVPWSGWEKVVGLWPLYGGVLFVAISVAIETKTSLGGRVGAFAFAIYTVVQLIADLLSYLRIFALSMAGAKMAETFGMLFGMIVDGAGVVLGVIFGIIILLIGHSINLVLNIMGGVIHGLRLNFIESYHWCLDGGGAKYSPLRKIKLESKSV